MITVQVVLCQVGNMHYCVGNLTTEKVRNDPVLSATLPSTGTTVGELLMQIQQSVGLNSDNNALLEFLSLISAADIKALQRGVKTFSAAYRYYKYNTNMTDLPLASYYFPDGGAISHMAWRLSKLKKEGVSKVGEACQVRYSDAFIAY